MNVSADDSLPEQLRRMNVGDIKVLAERLDQNTSSTDDIEAAMKLLRNRATTAITRASASGRAYHRDSLVTRAGDSHDPVVQVLITRTK
jgi:hypothetical protein